MYQLTKLSSTLAALGLSTILLMSPSFAATDVSSDQTANSNFINNNVTNSHVTTNKNNNINKATTDNTKDISPVTNGVSQKVTGNSKAAASLNKFLPTIKYTTDNLPTVAQKINTATWKEGNNIDRNLGTKLQALLNWSQHGVGLVDGYWGANTLKAMQAFQKANSLTVTDSLNNETWQALTKNEKLMTQPVLVRYQLSEDDVNIKTTNIPASAEAKAKLDGMYYESVTEGLAEKFHMSEKYLKTLNPNAKFVAGETITVYNPGNPNTKPVSRVVADKATKTLYVYDDKDNLIASYPTTVGSTATPSPTGTHTVEVKVHEPNYTYTADDGSKAIIPPGPNNPVGLVWIGLSKPSYGIHGSPDPARISRQASAGCIRLTNWDALALLGVIQDGATVEFK
ncbi:MULTISPECIES: L,D-transpeptidase family protein [unclassified Psychrobacter]|uniref:L,D-transpeptidase family protein n=1 Tax=unclassified Psychrobacter TaxID=196806 RepID=UPI0025D050A6|nr:MULTISPECIES: L,D-transpeptidase family protein [unclassified Psychrobacter]